MIEQLFLPYNGTFSQALLMGTIVGVIVGVLLQVGTSSAEDQFRIFFGFLAGVVLMGGFQAVQLGRLVATGIGQALESYGDASLDVIAGRVVAGFYRIAEAGIAGALLMLILFSPVNALRGAIGGALLGVLASLVVWLFVLLVGVRMPLLFFAVLVVVIGLALADLVSARA